MAPLPPLRRGIGIRAATAAASRRWLLSLVAIFASLLPTHSLAQTVAGDINYTRFPVFRIPFQTDAGDRRLKEIQLYVSTDKGQSWQSVVTVAPEQKYFDFRAPRDGAYWFSVRTVDLEGRPYPATMNGARPGLKVVVDTLPPVVRLRALPPRDGETGVEWEIQDDNLNPASLRLDYRLPAGEWLPLAADLPASGQRYFKPGTNGTVEIRLRAADLADNVDEGRLTATPGAVTAAGSGPITSVPQSVTNPPPNETGVRLVNSPHIALNYEIKDKGPSGVSVVELWCTQDRNGRSWQKCREESGELHPPFVVDVNGEGLYGFTLIVKSGVGLGDRPPQVGDQPQMWVEVDTTKPLVRLGNVDVGRGPDAGRLTISWSASDKNLGRQPISLSYAEQATGTWTAIAQNVENTGRFIWQMPAGVPYKFFVRVEATDRAGNSATSDGSIPVIVDLAQPKGVILDAGPAQK